MAGIQTDNGQPFKASGITKTFVQGSTSLEVLKGVDLEIAPGEMIAIVGTSGTGKTTLLQILGGLDRPTSGSIFYKGKNISLKDDRELSAFRIKPLVSSSSSIICCQNFPPLKTQCYRG